MMDTPTTPPADPVGWRFDNTYARLPEEFFAPATPARVKAPKAAVLNHRLAGELGLARTAGLECAEDAVPRIAYLERIPGHGPLLGHGEFKAKVAFSVYRASQSAIQAVEKAGGSVKILAQPKQEPAEPKGKNKRMALEAAKGGGKGEGKAKPKPAESETATE